MNGFGQVVGRFFTFLVVFCVVTDFDKFFFLLLPRGIESALHKFHHKGIEARKFSAREKGVPVLKIKKCRYHVGNLRTLMGAEKYLSQTRSRNLRAAAIREIWFCVRLQWRSWNLEKQLSG